MHEIAIDKAEAADNIDCEILILIIHGWTYDGLRSFNPVRCIKPVLYVYSIPRDG